MIEFDLVASLTDGTKIDVIARRNGGTGRQFATAPAVLLYFFGFATNTMPTFSLIDYMHWV